MKVNRQHHATYRGIPYMQFCYINTAGYHDHALYPADADADAVHTFFTGLDAGSFLHIVLMPPDAPGS